MKRTLTDLPNLANLLPVLFFRLNTKHLLLTLFIAIAPYLSLAQTTPDEFSKKFFEVYKQVDSDKALDYLFSNTPYASDIQEGIEDVKRQLKKTIGQVGKFYGSDLLAKRTAGPNLVMFTYLVRHTRQPLVFNIMYYKPDGKWQMQNFKYTSEIDNELEEASKAYRLKENFE